MMAYRIFEAAAIAALLFYSLRQILPLFPGLTGRLRQQAGRLGLPSGLLPEVPLKKEGCSTCEGCSGCGPAPETTKVITLHRRR